MASQTHWTLVVEVLRTGPADGQQILEHSQANNNLWENLYLASRSSPYAVAWREAFGRQRLTQVEVQSILELAVLELRLQDETISSNNDATNGESDRNTPNAVFVAKLIANCCADNDHNRRITIKAGALLPLMNLLLRGADPNILVPTIYNICADFEDPAEHLQVSIAESEAGQVQPTLAEERLATTDGSAKSVLSGIFVFLSPTVVLGCNGEIREYLTEIVEMAARPAAIAGFVSQVALANAFDRLLSSDGGRCLAEHSAKCRIGIIRALFALAASKEAKVFLASTGTIFDAALTVDIQNIDEDYYGDEQEEQQENMEALEGLKTAILKLSYEVCQLSQFATPPKYGIARQSLEIINTPNSSPFSRTVAYIVMYGFIDSNARAHLLASENVISIVVQALQVERDRTVIHPALGLLTKLAVTWSLRSELVKAGAMHSVQYLLTSADLGYEIPLNTVTFLELVTKGHPEHIRLLLSKFEAGQSIIDDIFGLFDKGHDAICLEIGRLLIETFATLAQQSSSEIATTGLDLNTFVAACDQTAVSQVLIFMGTKAQSADAAIAQRVWFALGLLSTTEHGKQVVLLALQDSDLQSQVRRLNQEVESWAGGNVKFMLYNLDVNINQICPAPDDDLDAAMSQMSLG